MVQCIATEHIPTFRKKASSLCSGFGKCSKSNQIFCYSSRTYKPLKINAVRPFESLRFETSAYVQLFATHRNRLRYGCPEINSDHSRDGFHTFKGSP